MAKIKNKNQISLDMLFENLKNGKITINEYHIEDDIIIINFYSKNNEIDALLEDVEIEIDKNKIPSNVSVGDKVYINSENVLLGEILEINENKIKFLNIKNTPKSNDYLFSMKNSLITGGNMRGYYLQFDMEVNTDKKVELYSINAEISKSNP